MIATAIPSTPRSSAPAWHQEFVVMLPTIRRNARIAFRHLSIEAREEAVQQVVANCVGVFVRLVELDKSHLAYATPIAQFGIRQVRSGRHVGCKLNVRDVTSRYCQLAKGIEVERLDVRDNENGGWREVLVEDKNATPADVAICRIDFATWLRTLRPKIRRIAKTLAMGETTKATARKFGLSSGRISQLRRHLMDAWLVFQGELPADSARDASGAEERLPANERSAFNRSLATAGGRI